MHQAMHVAGVQPVGARGLGGVQAVVTDAKPAPVSAPAHAGQQNRSPMTVTAEPVLFMRDGIPADQRPVHLRQQKAAARYKEAEELVPGRRRRRQSLAS